MKKMAVVVVVVCCVLLFSSLDVQAQQNSGAASEPFSDPQKRMYDGSNSPAACCFNILRNPKLPKNRVVSFQRTHTYCTKNAVVFKVKIGRKFCVDPTQAWVQEVIADVQSRRKN